MTLARPGPSPLIQIKVISWNVGGWTDDNECLRLSVINHFNADIICLGVTHLKGCKTISLGTDCRCYDHRRQAINTYAQKCSGGICFCIKLSILENNIIEGIYKCYDGI